MGQRIAFRWAFVFFVLRFLPFPLGDLPGMGWLDELVDKVWHGPTVWFAGHVLGVTQVSSHPSGSGDTLYHWVQLAFSSVLTTIIVAVWSLIDRRDRRPDALHELLRIYLRYTLALIMFGYGFAKVFKLQFPAPGPARLMESYGDASPMGLLWTFMGFSTPYSFFGGAGEVAGGLLLCFRRTTTLGALILCAVMGNVVLLNFCYDVPVKIGSSLYLIMALILLLPDARRLFHAFVLRRPVEERTISPPFASRRLNLARWPLKLAVIGFFIYTDVRDGAAQEEQWAAPPPLFGVYEVEDFTRDGLTLAPSLTEPTRWRRLIFDRGPGLMIQAMDDSRAFMRVQVDTAKKVVNVPGDRQDPNPSALIYARPDRDHLELGGVLRGHLIGARLKRVDDTKPLLTSRGFHWVSELPFNR